MEAKARWRALGGLAIVRCQRDQVMRYPNLDLASREGVNISLVGVRVLPAWCAPTIPVSS